MGLFEGLIEHIWAYPGGPGAHFGPNIRVQEIFANLAKFAKISCTRIFPVVQYYFAKRDIVYIMICGRIWQTKCCQNCKMTGIQHCLGWKSSRKCLQISMFPGKDSDRRILSDYSLSGLSIAKLFNQSMMNYRSQIRLLSTLLDLPQHVKVYI